ncbi:MAG: undecaprenyl-diphosphate phosphatase [Candidatus Protochlamydia sp.]|nr:undecaprenyl-diphosphate phosphatase [Candidatus Protochlamydia sp.]
MTTWEAFLLGLVQGITEFLPVSSSGHLELAQYFLGFQNLSSYVLFNLICHLGTLGAIFYFFFPEIKTSVTTQPKRFFQIVLGTLPLFPLVFILKPVKAIFDQPHYLGICFLVTSLLLFASVYVRPPQKKWLPQWSDPLAIGCFQAIAILPGISRSGATISAARLLGWDKQEAVRFSFLLAIPAILGGTVLEIWELLHLPASNAPQIGMPQFLAGFGTSFLVGCVALWALLKLMAKDKWVYFAWYCLILGIMTIFYFTG